MSGATSHTFANALSHYISNKESTAVFYNLTSHFMSQNHIFFILFKLKAMTINKY